MESIQSARDLLLFELNSAEQAIRETLADITVEEYDWEPIQPTERLVDLLLPPERKRVWRVYAREDVWTYDYTPEVLQPSPFTTIAWILNHIAQTADMYLYCIQTGEPEGISSRWEDLPVPANLRDMSAYLFAVLAQVRDHLCCIPKQDVDHTLNQLTPAPWGEMRPTFLNLWGGIIEHGIQHAMQISVRKEHIRCGY